MEKEKKQVLAFDIDVLIRKVHNKIALWHNNDKKISADELQKDLQFLSKDIIEDVIETCLGAYELKMGIIDKDGTVETSKKTAF